MPIRFFSFSSLLATKFFYLFVFWWLRLRPSFLTSWHVMNGPRPPTGVGTLRTSRPTPCEVTHSPSYVPWRRRSLNVTPLGGGECETVDPETLHWIEDSFPVRWETIYYVSACILRFHSLVGFNPENGVDTSTCRCHHPGPVWKVRVSTTNKKDEEQGGPEGNGHTTWTKKIKKNWKNLKINKINFV